MKATWITSAVAGAILGAVIHFAERDDGKADMALIMPVFFITGIVGAVGVSQFREMHAERKRRGLGPFGIMAEPSDFTRFYLPGWGRMLVWFISAVVTVFSLNAWFAE